MRTFFAVFLAIITVALVLVLNTSIGSIPAVGKLIDPVNGCWANAEAVNKDFNTDYKLPVQKTATVWYESLMIPHIHAANAHDVYFIEGYIHAMNRLWQMDMETRAAAGRVSEAVGDKALAFDRKQRRKGMGYAAENSLRAMEADPRTKLMMDAYTEGINKYISSLSYRDYPLEYKLIGFAPEQWTNLKSALLLKYMADDLTGGTDDIALTYLRDKLPKDQFDLLFPEKIMGSTPVIPVGTVFDKPSLTTPQAPPGSIAFPHFSTTDFGEKREDGTGSNNWALSGSRTASGAAILCNDPHLALNLPSLWYQVQLQTPDMNVCGVSLPGTPGVVIGFTDSVSWGLTNNYRDVKDFYVIKPVAENKNKYWFAGKQLDFAKRVEHIGVKGKADIVDTIDYTIHGPVTYEEQNAKDGGLRKPLAMCWMGHRATNELLAIYLLNRAKNYNDYVDAIMNFQCPAQNFAFADRSGNIAIWGQGQFVNKWKEQGRFVMEGEDSATLWKELIPMRENPHVFNPVQGFVASANESVTDSTYPYWYNGDFVELRAWRINQVLSGLPKATIQDMFDLQQDTYSFLAANALSLMFKFEPWPAYKIDIGNVCVKKLQHWSCNLTAESDTATMFQIWWNMVANDLWGSNLGSVPNHLIPLQERTMQLLKAADEGQNTSFPQFSKDSLTRCIVRSLVKTIDSVRILQKTLGTANWYKVKNTSITHLAKLPAFSYDHLKIGGWGNTVNAAKGDHGPSWRMVVQMGKEIEAYGVYPGGQSGNPGSRHYADFIDSWAAGRYYRLQFLPNTDTQNNDAIKYTCCFHN